MTSIHDSFGDKFDAAVENAHTHGHRADAPSHNTWNSIRAGIQQGPKRAETADPRATGPDPAAASRRTQRMREESEMDVALAPQVASPPRARRAWMSWAAIALVGVLLASSLFTVMQPSQNGGNDDLAWAPGLGTPESTPAMANACTVEPLTTEEVMDTVLNPNRGYIRLGSTSSPSSDSMWEPEDAYLLNQLPSDPQNKAEMGPSLFEPANEQTSAELEASGKELWTCLQEGSSFQVWGILDPILVQQIILDNFPVIRTEPALRAYINEVGPIPFIDSSADRFSAISSFSTADTAVVTESHVFEPESPVANERFARVHFASPEQESFVFRLFVREVEPDMWIIYELTPQPA